MFHCPICGKPLYGGMMYGRHCRPTAVARRERDLRQYGGGDNLSADCPRCGRALRTPAEKDAGLCPGCQND